MTASMVAKYCAMEEMNGRINPAMSDSDEDSNGKIAGIPPLGVGGAPTSIPSSHLKSGSNKKQQSASQQSQSEDESDSKRPVKSVKQYQTQL